VKKLLVWILAIFIVSSGLGPAQAIETPYPVLESEAAILMDAATGQVLFAKNMHEQLSPASITKIMTILLGLEHGQTGDTLTMSREAVFSIEFGSSHIALDTGEQITLEQALMATMLASANEAANGIAEYVSGSIDQFVVLMNQRALEAGALHTHFVNPNGLYAEDHLTTAYDMAVITRAALQNQDFRRIFGTVKYEIPATNKQPQTRYLWAEHKMFPDYRYEYDGMVGGKTGYTQKSQNTLVTVARRDDRELIVVVIKSQNSAVYTDTKALFDYGFDEFVQVPIVLPAVSEANSSDLPADTMEDIRKMVGQVKAGANSRLLHKNVSSQDVKIDYTFLPDSATGHPLVRADIGLANPSPYMYGDLGAMIIGQQSSTSQTLWSRMATLSVLVAKVLAGLAGGLIILLFALKAFFTLRRKLRRKQRRPDRVWISQRGCEYEQDQH